ncbi:hypothetical protein FGB62_42g00 [Gracilaria domingensis]|nr:hypothetical protein FGB62_42g00 [Gracilaria domingensis]
MLGSSPVMVARSPTEVGPSKQQTPPISMLVGRKVKDLFWRNSLKKSVVNPREEKEHPETMAKNKESSPKPGKKRKRRKISWDTPEKLEEVHVIDTRAELIKFWGPDLQITLLFAQTTLQMFQAEQQPHSSAQRSCEDDDKNAKGGIQIRRKPKLSTFEEARKREHEMELERARWAREEQNRRLDSMSPKRPWRRTLAIVLPAECRKDRAEIEDYNIVCREQPPSLNYDDPNRTSPQSPIQGSQSSRGSYFAEGNLSSQTPLYTLQQDVQEYYGASN